MIIFQLSVIMEGWVACHKVQRFFLKPVFLQLSKSLCFTAISPSEPVFSVSETVTNKKLDDPRAD